MKASSPRFSQDPTNAAFVQNPYDFYDRTRASGPLFFWDDYGMGCLTSFALVDGVLRDRRFGRERPSERAQPIPNHLREFMAFESHSMLELEPPRHSRLRGLVVRAFTSRRIASMDKDIRSLSNDLIDRFPQDPFDVLPAFAEQIPVIIIARLLGVPEEMAPQLLAWSHDMVAMYQANRTKAIEHRAAQATREFSDFMRGYVNTRRKSPRDDLITTLIAAEEEGERLSTDELITTAILLLNAGHEATVHAIGNGVRLLLTMGTAAHAYCRPENITKTTEEILRFDPPLHMFTRYAYEDMTLAGHKINRGEEIGLLLAAANRDPEKFSHPNQFDPGRADAALTSFGAGVHFCIGAPLARLEMQIALPILFDRCPNLRADGDNRFADRYHFHGLKQLMVRA